MSEYGQCLFQESLSPIMTLLENFHQFAVATISAILVIVLGLTVLVTFNKLPSIKSPGVWLELVWTILPAFVLISLAIPSLRILYLMDSSQPFMTIKSVGHQWYWSYETPSSSLDSYLNSSTVRLLDVDNRLYLPMEKSIRALVTSSDVLHCWAVPSLGVKVDAVPGRLNQVNFNILRASVLYGQCSEICGANHSFMPICVESF